MNIWVLKTSGEKVLGYFTSDEFIEQSILNSSRNVKEYTLEKIVTSASEIHWIDSNGTIFYADRIYVYSGAVEQL